METTKQWLDRLIAIEKEKIRKRKIKQISNDNIENLNETYFFQTSKHEKNEKGEKKMRKIEMTIEICPICGTKKRYFNQANVTDDEVLTATSSKTVKNVCQKCKINAQKNGFNVRKNYLSYGEDEIYKIRFENVKKKVSVLWEEMRDEIDIFGDGKPQSIDWSNITRKKRFTYGEFVKSKNKIDYVETRKLSQLNWETVSEHQRLSTEFMEKFKNFLNWDSISKRQILGEEAIRRFQDKIIWILIVEYQDISIDMMNEFEEEIAESYIQREEPNGN